jgi:hypothetical protein
MTRFWQESLAELEAAIFSPLPSPTYHSCGESTFKVSVDGLEWSGVDFTASTNNPVAWAILLVCQLEKGGIKLRINFDPAVTRAAQVVKMARQFEHMLRTVVRGVESIKEGQGDSYGPREGSTRHANTESRKIVSKKALKRGAA